MFDLFIGKAPTANRQMEEGPSPIQTKIRQLLRIARNSQRDRRKNTSERRYRQESDVIVDLSNRPERRVSLDRRQKLEFKTDPQQNSERRRSRFDRRKAVREGIYVSLSTKNDRRLPLLDRRSLKSS